MKNEDDSDFFLRNHGRQQSPNAMVPMTAPDGKQYGWVPKHRVREALESGFRYGHIHQKEK